MQAYLGYGLVIDLASLKPAEIFSCILSHCLMFLPIRYDAFFYKLADRMFLL